MENLSKDQIISAFKKAGIIIKESNDCKANKGMIVVIHDDYGLKLFPNYYTAYCFYSSINLITNI